MSSIDDILTEKTDRPIAARERVVWLQIFLVLMGIYISLPGFLTGTKVAAGVGFHGSLLAFFGGGLVLGTVSALCAVVGANTGLSTYMIIKRTFGEKGGILINMVFASSLFGWFGVTSSILGHAVEEIFSEDSALAIAPEYYMAIGGVLIISVAIFGFKAIKNLAHYAVPFLALALGGLVYTAVSKAGWPNIAQTMPTQEMRIGDAVSAVIGGSIVGAILVPDLCRYAKSWLHGVWAVVLAFALGKPILLLTSAIPMLATGNTDMMNILSALNLGSGAFLVIVVAAWTTNNGNLYSATLSLSTIVPGPKYWQLALVAGILGTLLAIFGIAEHFISFLHLLGIMMPPVAGVYLVHYFLVGHGDAGDVVDYRPSAILSWLLACVVGFSTLNGVFSLTQVPALDAILSAATIYGLSAKVGVFLATSRNA